jgi:anti-anti-sigma factor
MIAPIRQQVPPPQLSARDRGDVTVASLRGELDFRAVSALQAYLSDIRARGQPRGVADLTGLAFIDCACLGVLARHSRQIRARGGSFALAGPQGAVRRILSVTGLITWFEVHDTVGQAIAAGHQSTAFPAAPAGPGSSPAGAASGQALSSPRSEPYGVTTVPCPAPARS